MLKRMILLTSSLIMIFSGIIFYGELTWTTAESITTEELYQDTLSFLEYLQTADYAKATEQFDEKVKATLPEKEFEELWTKMTRDLVELTSWGNFRTSEQGGYQITLLACNFEKVSLDLRLAFNQEGKISGFQILPAALTEEYEYIPPRLCKKRPIFRDRNFIWSIGVGVTRHTFPSPWRRAFPRSGPGSWFRTK